MQSWGTKKIGYCMCILWDGNDYSCGHSVCGRKTMKMVLRKKATKELRNKSNWRQQLYTGPVCKVQNKSSTKVGTIIYFHYIFKQYYYTCLDWIRSAQYLPMNTCFCQISYTTVITLYMDYTVHIYCNICRPITYIM